MKIALIADTFPPLRNSGAVQLRDLSREFVAQGHQLTVILPSWEIKEDFLLEEMEGFQVLRLKSPKTKDVNYARRTLSEFLMPFFMKRGYRKSTLRHEKWDGVAWYAPSIFHAPFVKYLKKASDCKGYLIIRDIFPEWAVDMGLMGRGIIYRFFSAVAHYQYSVADIIGVQTPGNLSYFEDWKKNKRKKLVVLQNWLADTKSGSCSISINETKLVGRKIFVYAGNMGVAQGMDILVDLAEKLKDRRDIGFLFVGRGSEAKRLAEEARKRSLDNIEFKDEIHPDEIPALYAQCSVGIVSLDQRHKSHNIPGKFLSYMQSGIPVLANINPGNDLAELIRSEGVGVVCEDADIQDMEHKANILINSVEMDADFQKRCRAVYWKMFSPSQAVNQIVLELKS
ncbi:glycosyltransferase family 4 protein [Comamonas sp. Y33R10-2]|uniref:glycosyltransferase family 4 protein n=1 Tax=Comamonas sp. Y33R10-2 TaxID=2853257 RepID=UPI001C5CB6CA|nr:glycosyltransferase family 4 protein [Comamonas sp. Y33R10-2]QXZ09314.1 glycosyltransferase family 4 protein [Comamonas sp. Y33R10-2]